MSATRKKMLVLNFLLGLMLIGKVAPLTSYNPNDYFLSASPCTQPPVTGPCLALFMRLYFDSKTGQCKKFKYGGCGGNDNNFLTMEECVKRCGGKVAQLTWFQPNDYFLSASPCTQPPITGPCLARFVRLYFDSNAGQCKEFLYGGCGGNDNNFLTMEDCVKRCGVPPMAWLRLENYPFAPGSICMQGAITGNCLASFERFHFDRYTNRCKMFIYGGCGGNDNNFFTIEECIKICGLGSLAPNFSLHLAIPHFSLVALCTQIPDKGPCSRDIPRFYFNYITNECSIFTYGGCKGNDNNFENLEVCKEKCQGVLDRKS